MPEEEIPYAIWSRYLSQRTPEHMGACTLCGNSGIIHTEAVRSPTGRNVGRANFCICPNGQTLYNAYGGSMSAYLADR